MKKLLFVPLFLVLILTSCSVYSPSYYSETSFIDYSFYSNEGFFITESNSVNFDYTPIGSVSTVVLSGYVKTSQLDTLTNEIYGSKEIEKTKHVYVFADVNEAMSLMVSTVKKNGANGIINFSIEPYRDIKNNREGLILTGMSILK